MKAIYLALSVLCVVGWCWAAPSTSLPVGVILPLSGPAASYGELVKRGLADCRPARIRFEFEDDACEPAKTVTAYRKLSATKETKLFIGPACGAGQQAVAPMLEKDASLALFPTTTARSLSPISGSRIFSTASAADDESKFNARAIHELGINRVALLFTEGDNSRPHEEAFRNEFRGTIVDVEAVRRWDSPEVRSVLMKLKELHPDALYIPDAAPFYSKVLTQMAELRMRNIPVFSIYAAQSRDVLAAEGTAAEGLVYSYPKISGDDAIVEASRRACEILEHSIEQCSGAIDCIYQTLKRDSTFDGDGIIKQEFELKTVRNGKFDSYN